MTNVGGIVATVALLIRANPRRALLSMTLTLLGAFASPLIGLSLARLTDAALAGRATEAILLGVLSGALAVALLTMSHFAHNIISQVGDEATISFDGRLIEMVQGSADLTNHENPDYADRLAMLQEEIQGLTYAVNAVIGALAVLAQLVLTMVLLGSVQPILFALPVVAVAPYLAGRIADRSSEAARLRVASVRRSARSILETAQQPGPSREIRLAGIADELRDRQRRLLAQEAGVVGRAEARGAMLRAAAQVIFAAAYGGTLLLVVRQAILGHATVGDVVLAVVLTGQVNAGVSQLLAFAWSLRSAVRIGQRWAWLRNADGLRRPVDEGTAAPAMLRHGVRLRDVGFRYAGTDRDVLHGVDLEIPAGSVVAIVGENGAGKTTLVKLVCRLHEPTSGRIDVDGTDLDEIAAARWQESIAAAFQDFGRFEFVAAETVGVGDLPRMADRSVVVSALDRAGSHDLTGTLPAGLDTPIGTSFTGGVELSGGQWQKLALGRAMMRLAPLLLVLDEPTASLDAAAEHELFERHAQASRQMAAANGTITLLVSHRFSTVSMADLIVVVDDARIRETGTHAELMANGGLYAEMFELQAAGYRS